MAKILALIEIDEKGFVLSKQPEEIYFTDVTDSQVKAVLTEARRLRKENKTLRTVSTNQNLRLDANFDEIVKMGFVHVSELDKFLEKKLIEIEHRISIRFYYKNYVKDPIKKHFMRIVGKVGGSFVKNIFKR